ncbi:hypothetical protein RFI_19081 [Reticulomyxa filosa]|uniref:Uncharacterized protein n=1 Tax=Reticulomyxa filosa TaxID=46433 RepID=X6MXI6_RETFI|nr:hypothetical protein RFI_35956 [Reticulomyxa filosa]ETO18197.1 hypothetical protein RFI_19081 [Reticulomyxa filosa]|eukprot:ETO01484.1 hypothetical protein RFI_35956 [Reticulomyxa filosa]
MNTEDSLFSEYLQASYYKHSVDFYFMSKQLKFEFDNDFANLDLQEMKQLGLRIRSECDSEEKCYKQDKTSHMFKNERQDQIPHKHYNNIHYKYETDLEKTINLQDVFQSVVCEL